MKLVLSEVVQKVRSLATEQGQLAVSRWSSAVASAKEDRRDLVTEVDVEIERNIKAALGAWFPGHGLRGEETGAENAGSEYQWLIDPIDGTKYYAGQSSLFSVSIGLLLHDSPVLGAVCNASSGQCFYAYEGGGAWLDGRRLSGPAVDDVSRVVANLDTPGTHELSEPEREWFERKLLQLTRQLYRVRALGQGSLAACWLASGALDAYVDLTGYVKAHDLAAGRIIMKEAGARVEYIRPPVGPARLLAAPPMVFAQMQRLLLD